MGEERRALQILLKEILAVGQDMRNEAEILREYRRAGIEPPANGHFIVSPSLACSIRSPTGTSVEQPPRPPPKDREIEHRAPCSALERALTKLQAAKASR
jgi:hypothetical protein